MLAARFTAVVVFPTPPFWLATASTLPIELLKLGPAPVGTGRSIEVRGRTRKTCLGWGAALRSIANGRQHHRSRRRARAANLTRAGASWPFRGAAVSPQG